MKRRDLVKSITLLPLVGGSTVSLGASVATLPAERDFFKELGIRVFINAAGTYTFMTASLMPPEVVEAIRVSAKQFAILDDVQDKVGEQIARIMQSRSGHGYRRMLVSHCSRHGGYSHGNGQQKSSACCRSSKDQV